MDTIPISRGRRGNGSGPLNTLNAGSPREVMTACMGELIALESFTTGWGDGPSATTSVTFTWQDCRSFSLSGLVVPGKDPTVSPCSRGSLGICLYQLLATHFIPLSSPNFHVCPMSPQMQPPCPSFLSKRNLYFPMWMTGVSSSAKWKCECPCSKSWGKCHCHLKF